MNKVIFTLNDSRQSSSRPLEPGHYVLDVRRAVERLAGGRLAGICKVCAREFRIPLDLGEWSSFLQSMIQHPLEHEQSRETANQVSQALEAMNSLSPESAETWLAEIIADRLQELDATGILVRVRRES